MGTRDFHEEVDPAAIRALCRTAQRDLAAVVDRAVSRIREVLPEYGLVPLEEHRAAVWEQLENRLVAVGADRPPAQQDLDSAARLARARAAQRVPISTLIDAYHIGDSEVWQAVVAAADEGTAPQLPRIASRMIDTLHTLSAQLTAAHSEVTQTLQGNRITLVHRLIELLSSGVISTELAAVAAALEMSAEQTWQAHVWVPDHADDDISFDLQARISALADTIVCAPRDNALVVVSDVRAGQRVRRFVERELRSGTLGVGMPRVGLDGAAASVEDARLAVSVAGGPGEVCSFEEDWIQACLLSHHDRLGPLLDQAITVAKEHPHLADAVVAQWEGSLSIAVASERMNLHPNSVTYRLSRWQELSGLNPRSVTGLTQSWIAVLAARKADE